MITGDISVKSSHRIWRVPADISHGEPHLKRLCLAVTSFLLAASASAAPLDHGDWVTVSTRPGVSQSLFIESPTPHPQWVAVLFAGSPGDLHLGSGGATTLKGNFLIRSASHWIDYGDAVVLVDTPSDHAQGVDDLFRLGKESFGDTKAIVAEVRSRFPDAKIALVGTSAGTVSVGNALERDPAIADAFVLTSPVTVSRRNSPGLAGFLDVDGAKHRVLVVSNKNDRCAGSPAYAGKRLASSNHYDFVEVESTEGDSDDAQQCAAHSPHGFLGIETEVLGDINDWLNGQPARPH
jgi:hypothetical protein